MPKLNLFAGAALLVVSLASPKQAWAIDLLESYRLARSNDADLQAARAAADAAKEAQPMALASMLPNVSASASQFDNRLETTTKLTSRFDEYPSKSASLTLRQPLFRPALVFGYNQSKAQVRGVFKELEAAEREGIIRVTAAYFDLSQARFDVETSDAQIAALQAQFRAAEAGFRAGTGTRTDIDDVRARLDLAQARKLQAEQRLALLQNQLENLIGVAPDAALNLSPEAMPLELIGAQTLDDWLGKARDTNPSLAAARARVDMAEIELKKNLASRLPTVDGVIQRVLSKSDNITNPDARYLNSQFGVQISMPLYQGGYMAAKHRQSRAQLREAQAQVLSSERRLASMVREQFFAVQAGILKVQALELAAKSAGQAVLSNEKGIVAGMRSRVELLNAIQVRFETLSELNRARVSYVLARLKLLSLAGELSEEDIATVDSWLERGADS